MSLQYTETHRTTCMDDLVTALGSTGYLFILTGAQPASVATVDTGTLLASLPLSSTAGTVTDGVLTFNAITSAAAAAAGTAGHFLLASSSNSATAMEANSTTRVIQGAIATTGSDLNFPSTSFTEGETIGISSFTITANGA